MMESCNTGATLRELELEVAREVAHAFLTAAAPVEVYRVALSRLTPLVRASFSSVFEKDPHDPSLLKLTCANSWPQSSARFLGQLRLRVGRGPTGRAVAEGHPVEVSNVFTDLALREWWEPARELGFTSLISVPLRTGGEPSGAVTFYFAGEREFDDDERHLLTLIADQLALTGSRAATLEAQRREVEQLRAENSRLRSRIGAGEEARRMKDEFLSNISHELRTPLTSILGYANLLEQGDQGPLTEEQRASLGRIDHSANVLLGLITDLLQLSQLKLGRAMLSVAPDDAVLIARRALAAAGDPPPHVTVRLDASAERLPVLTDGDKVVHMLENLLTNAYKFTADGSVELIVAEGVEGGRRVVEWIVTDTGIGIAPEQLEAIFDEFKQVDGSSTRLYGGTGLGLALARHTADLLGGRITVESEPARGSRFRLVLPVET
jgi:signal transduction histidine kinase